MAEHGGVDGLSVVDAIPDEAIDFLIDLSQQVRYLRRILFMAFRYRGRDNLPLIIDAEMELFPALDLLLPVFLCMPFALTAYF